MSYLYILSLHEMSRLVINDGFHIQLGIVALIISIDLSIF